MPTYTVVVTVELYAESPSEAHRFIRQGMKQIKIADVVYQDSDIIETQDEDGNLVTVSGKD